MVSSNHVVVVVVVVVVVAIAAVTFVFVQGHYLSIAHVPRKRSLFPAEADKST